MKEIREEPRELDLSEPPDPGTVIAGRYRVSGPPTHHWRGYSVHATDLCGEYGDAPDHEVLLSHHRTSPSARDRVLSAARLSGAQPEVLAHLRTRNGILLVAATVDPLPEDFPIEAAYSFGRCAARLVASLHADSFYGIVLDPGDIGMHEGRVLIRSFAHLRGTGEAASDLASLARTVEEITEIPIDHLDYPDEVLQILEDHGYQRPFHLPEEPPLVGRDTEMTTVREAVAQARTARAQLLWFSGPNGVGKSRLCAEIENTLQRAGGVTVLSGSVEGRRHHGLSSVFSQLAQQGGDARHLKERLIRATAPHGRTLTRLAPELDAWFRSDDELEDIPPAEDLSRHASVVSRALQVVGTASCPAVVILDAVEDHDLGTHEVLRRLFESAEHHTVVIVTSFEPPEMPEARHLPLAFLGPADVRDLLGQLLAQPNSSASELAELLVEHTGGDPFSVWSTLCLHGGAQVPEIIDSLRAQERPKGMAQHRFEALNSAQRELLLHAAVRDGSFDAQWLSRVSAVDETRTSLLLAAARECDVVRRAGRSSYDFASNDIRLTLVSEASSAQLREVHTRVADWLARERGPVSDVELAHHRELGSPPGADPELARLHCRAGWLLLELFDLERASWHFDCADQRNPGDPRSFGSEIEHGRARVAAFRHQTDEAFEHYRKAIERANTPLAVAQLGADGVYALYKMGENVPAIDLGDRALQKIKRPSPRRVLGKIWTLILLLWSLVRRPTEEAELRDALCRLHVRLNAVLLAEPSALPFSVLAGASVGRHLPGGGGATARAFYGLASSTTGKLDWTRTLFDQAEELAGDSSDWWSLGVVYHMRAHGLELASGNYDVGQRYLDDAIQAFERSGDLTIAAISYLFKAIYGLNREPRSLVLQWVDRAEDAARRHGNVLAAYPASAMQLLVRARAGDDVRGEAYVLRQRLDAAANRFFPHEESTARGILAETLAATGNISEALEELDKGLALLKTPTIETSYQIAISAALILSQVPTLTRQQRKTLRRVQRALRHAGRYSPRIRAIYHLAAARRALQASNTGKAVRHCHQVLSQYHFHGDRLVAASAHELLASLIRGTDVLAASEHVRQMAALRAELERDPAGDRGEARSMGPVRTPTAPVAGARGKRVLLSDLLTRMEPMLVRSIEPTPLVLHLEHDCEVDAVSTESVLAYLVLTARDIAGDDCVTIAAFRRDLTQAEAAASLGGIAGPHLLLTVRLLSRDGPQAPMSLARLQRAVQRLRGFVSTGSEGRTREIIVHLPLQPRHATSASEERPG